MIKRKRRSSVPGGFYRFDSIRMPRSTVSGSGYGEYIRLRDERGNIWRGQAELLPDDSICYRFRDEDGRTITGMSDTYGIVLRDEKGNVWRGFVD
ncbi:MAG: hypothetical protein JNK87_36460 [Bryobacterales bacterium]|nr:hypothetical protein [Bryobacterales bacterium]